LSYAYDYAAGTSRLPTSLIQPKHPEPFDFQVAESHLSCVSFRLEDVEGDGSCCLYSKMPLKTYEDKRLRGATAAAWRVRSQDYVRGMFQGTCVSAMEQCLQSMRMSVDSHHDAKGTPNLMNHRDPSSVLQEWSRLVVSPDFYLDELENLVISMILARDRGESAVLIAFWSNSEAKIMISRTNVVDILTDASRGTSVVFPLEELATRQPFSLFNGRDHYLRAVPTSAGRPASQQVLRILVGAHLTDDLVKSGPNKELNYEVPKDQAAYCASRRNMHSAADCDSSTEDLWEHVQMPDMAAMALITGRSVVHISRSLTKHGDAVLLRITGHSRQVLLASSLIHHESPLSIDSGAGSLPTGLELTSRLASSLEACWPRFLDVFIRQSRGGQKSVSERWVDDTQKAIFDLMVQIRQFELKKNRISSILVIILVCG